MISNLKSIKSIKKLKNKRILVRCDFDVPLKKIKGKIIITDDSRLKDSLATINYLINKQAKVILIGHLGRPGGKINKNLSLRPIRQRLEKLLSKKIELVNIDRYIDQTIIKKSQQLYTGQIMMLENLRFSDRERANCKRFAKQLANLAEIYVDNAFANSHRQHASISAIQNYLPTYYGFNILEEIKALSKVLYRPTHPLILVIGGAKVETKLPVIKKYLKLADYILVGGAVANTFIKSLDYQVGKSLVDKKYLSLAKKLLHPKIILPVDVVTNKMIKRVDMINSQEAILDIGPATIKLYSSIIKSAKTIIWNGPMGKFEDKKFRLGTQRLAQYILKTKADVVIGGGDTAEVLLNKKIPKNIFISTGGGAMLEFLSGNMLPAFKK